MISATPLIPANRLRSFMRVVAAIGFVCAGANHLLRPRFYQQIVPPMFPAAVALVAISGVCEIVGGLALLIRPLRRAAGWGLVALLLAVFPANVYMAVAPDRVPRGNLPVWVLWIRLPLQAVFIAWVWWVARDRPRSPDPVDRKTLSHPAE